MTKFGDLLVGFWCGVGLLNMITSVQIYMVMDRLHSLNKLVFASSFNANLCNMRFG